MIDKRALLSSTAVPAPPEPDRYVRAGDLYPGWHYYTKPPEESPHTLTRENFLQAMDRMIENDMKPRPRWPSPEEIHRLSRQPIPTEAERRKEELEVILLNLETAGSVAEFFFWWDAACCHTLMYGDGSGRPLGLMERPRDHGKANVKYFEFYNLNGHTRTIPGSASHLTSRRK